MDAETPAASNVQDADVPSTGAEEPERASFSDPLPMRSHALDPAVAETEESREQAPPSPRWLLEGGEKGTAEE